MAGKGLAKKTLASRARSLIGLGPDLAIGLGAALGQAPWGLWPISILAFALLIWRSATAADLRQGGLRLFAAGFGYFALAMFWITEPFLVEAEIYGWMAPFALILIGIGGALFWTLPGLLALRLTKGSWRARGIAVAAALVLSDWIRGWLFTGLPWALAGHIWIDTPAGQFAAIGGSIGLSALTLFAATLPIAFWRGPASKWRCALPGAVLGMLTIALAWSFGAARLAQPLPPDRPVLLRLVQPNAEQKLKWDPYWSGVFFRRMMALSEGPTASGQRPDAVIWPETAVNFLLDYAEDAPTVITQRIGAPVLLGIQRSEGDRYFNSFAEFRRDGSIGEVYDKFHLVPFGEYTPWGDQLSQLGISAFAARYGNGYTPGPGPRILADLGGLPAVQVLICYEAIFSRHLLTRAEERPEWLLQITNDAWFGTISGPWQHLAQARLRAIESGLPLVRVANTGVTALIGPRGEIRAELGLNEEGRLDVALPAPLPQTLWGRWRDLPAVLLAFAMLLAAICAGSLKSRRTQG